MAAASAEVISELSGRPLAYVEHLGNIEDIEGADRIALSKVRGWPVVVNKAHGMKSGDLVVYFEIDSKLPKWQCFIDDNLEKKNFRIKTTKLRGKVSQGYVISLAQLAANHPLKDTFSLATPPNKQFPVITFNETSHKQPIELAPGTNLTSFIGVKQFSPDMDDDDDTAAENKTKNTPPPKLKYYPWPEVIPKTDQPRIQNLPDFAKEFGGDKMSFEVTEKLDGSSVTVMCGDKPGEAWVCSRNYRLWASSLEEVKSVVEGLPLVFLEHEGIVEKVRQVSASGRRIALQGEMLGPKISGNLYKLTTPQWRIFDVYLIDEKRYALPDERMAVLKSLGLEPAKWHVPVLQKDRRIDPMMTSEMLVQEADGLTVMVQQGKQQHVKREGLVFKSNGLVNGELVHFKAVSNSYLLSK